MFTFLGTGSGENYPNSWCGCANCQSARDLGGKNIRSNTSALLGDHTLVDFGPNVAWQVEQAGHTLANIQSLFLTHTHFDHYAPWYLRWRLNVPGLSPLKIFGSPEAYKMAESAIKGNWKDHCLDFRVITAWDVIETEHLIAVVLPANHDDRITCLNFLFIVNGYKVLYAVDSSGISDDVLNHLSNSPLDLVVMDANWGTAKVENAQLKGHASFETNRSTLQEMRQRGILKESAIFAVTHLSPHYAPPHEECEKILTPLGLTVPYDGMRVEW